jgi:site-specific DNA recombinase
VITRLRTFFSDQGAILDAIRDQHADGAGQNRLIGRGRQIEEELGTLAPDQIRAMLMALLSRIDIRPDHVEISIRRDRLVELLTELSIDPTTQGGKLGNDSEDVLTLMVRARLQRVIPLQSAGNCGLRPMFPGPWRRFG